RLLFPEALAPKRAALLSSCNFPKGVRLSGCLVSELATRLKVCGSPKERKLPTRNSISMTAPKGVKRASGLGEGKVGHRTRRGLFLHLKGCYAIVPHNQGRGIKRTHFGACPQNRPARLACPSTVRRRPGRSSTCSPSGPRQGRGGRARERRREGTLAHALAGPVAPLRRGRID